MAKKTKADTQSASLLDDDSVLAGIVSTFSLVEIKLKELKWLCKLSIRTTLPKSYHQYNMIMELDEQPYLDRIDDVEAQLNDSLFSTDKSERSRVNKEVKEMNERLAELRSQCERMEFAAVVEEVKYKAGDTVIVVRIPDDVIEPLNRQKTRLSLYKITLDPIYG